MLYHEAQFVNRISSSVKNFKQKKAYLWNFSCQICGDVSKNIQKARGYVYLVNGRLNYKCHHCGTSISFISYLKTYFPGLYKEYLLEKFRDTKTISIISESEKQEIVTDSVLGTLIPCNKLSVDHYAIKYLLERKIPLKKWNLLYYADNFMEYTNSILPSKFIKEVVKKYEHSRLVIPFFNAHGKVFAYVGRALNGETPRYYTIKIDPDQDVIYGLERIDYTKKVYAVEGPIDSLFLDNAIAVGGSSFDCVMLQSIKGNLTIIPDNEPRNKEIVKIISRTIDKGYSVCLLPDSIKAKDINDMILSGIDIKRIKEMIDSNTFSGLEAKLKFTEWRKR